MITLTKKTEERFVTLFKDLKKCNDDFRSMQIEELKNRIFYAKDARQLFQKLTKLVSDKPMSKFEFAGWCWVCEVDGIELRLVIANSSSKAKLILCLKEESQAPLAIQKENIYSYSGRFGFDGSDYGDIDIYFWYKYTGGDIQPIALVLKCRSRDNLEVDPILNKPVEFTAEPYFEGFSPGLGVKGSYEQRKPDSPEEKKRKEMIYAAYAMSEENWEDPRKKKRGDKLWTGEKIIRQFKPEEHPSRADLFDIYNNFADACKS